MTLLQTKQARKSLTESHSKPMLSLLPPITEQPTSSLLDVPKGLLTAPETLQVTSAAFEGPTAGSPHYLFGSVVLS